MCKVSVQAKRKQPQRRRLCMKSHHVTSVLLWFINAPTLNPTATYPSLNPQWNMYGWRTTTGCQRGSWRNTGEGEGEGSQSPGVLISFERSFRVNSPTEIRNLWSRETWQTYQRRRSWANDLHRNLQIKIKITEYLYFTFKWKKNITE